MRTLRNMPGHPRLYRRGSTYYHRAAVPQDIVETYGKREETFSLRTKDRAEALVRVRIEAVRVDEKFAEHRRRLVQKEAFAAQPPAEELTPAQIAKVKAAYLHHLLEEDEEVRLEGFEDPADPYMDIEDAPRPTFTERQTVTTDMDEVTRSNLAQGKRDQFFKSEAEEVLTWDGIKLRLAEGSPSWPRLIRALQEAAVEAHKAVSARDEGESIPTPEYPESGPSTRSDGSPPLSEAVREWEAEKKRGAWSEKVRNDYMTWVASFIEVAGDRPLSEYAKEDARSYKAVLMRLPANWRKNPKVRNLSLMDAADKAHQLGLPPMSTANLNKAIRRVSAFWHYAEAHYDGIRPALFKGLTVKEKVAARDQKDPFSPDQLSLIFKSPIYTGCHSERRCAEPGDHSMRGTARFWLPLLGLYTGARLNELCQLTPSDVKEEKGIWYLDITDKGEGQRVKTVSGKRRIPVHRKLIAEGFLEFASERLREGAVWVFPELTEDASGYRSGEFSKFFSRYLQRIGAKTAKTSFHSFRHNFEDACRNGGVQPHIMNALQGHSEEGMAGRYGAGGYPLGVLKEAVECLVFEVAVQGH